MEDEQSIAKIVKTLRVKRGWTQKDLAVKTGLDACYLGHVEQGFRTDLSLSTLKKLANAFEVSLDVLAGQEEDTRTVVVQEERPLPETIRVWHKPEKESENPLDT